MEQIEKAELIRLASGTDEEQQQVMQYCYNLIDKYIRFYMEMDEDYYPIINLWIMGTYIHKKFNSYPYLFFCATTGSGKSRLLNLIANFANNGEMLGNLTDATLFRTANQKCHCIDEFESIKSKELQTLRELLNSGYKKGLKVPRQKEVMTNGNRTYVTEYFEMYSPICMANINGMNDVLGNRCISFILDKNDGFKTKLVEGEGFNEEFRGTLDVIKICCENKFGKGGIGEWNNFIMLNNTPLQKSVGSDGSVAEGGLWEKGERKEESMLNNTPKDTSILNNIPNDITLLNNTSISDGVLPTQPTPPTPTLLTLPTLTNNIIINNNILNNNDIFKYIYESNITGRDLELYFPILILASFVNNDIFFKVLEIAKEMVLTKKQNDISESCDVMFLDYLSKMPYSELDWVPIARFNRDFKDYVGYDVDWIKPEWISHALKRLNLVIETKRTNEGISKRIEFAKAREKLKMFTGMELAVSLEMSLKTKKETKIDAKSEIMAHFKKLADEAPQHDVLLEEWYDKFKDKYSFFEFDKIVQKIKNEGYIFEPKNGYFQGVN
ncbi:hypothetical protein M0R04_11385 [Candidatus Dojkabacteria bacterium]|jgi:hypothetical protein|nr:hypothetical protein [Candidatus Dojkabacteria bacterium]